jgi:site-specific DNA recombinase
VSPERIYRDDGVSGARLDRPALDRLRDAVLRGEVATILIASPDRLARRYAYQVWLLEEFERAGCRVIFLDRPPSDDPQDLLVIQIRGAVAEYERTIIADRMRRGRLAALREGRLLPWTVPPFAYRLDPRRPRDPAGVRIEEQEAALVRRLFAWYVEDGLTLFAIAKRLTEQGIPTAQGKAIWRPSSVRAILTNPAYTGTTYGNQKRLVPAKRHHPLSASEMRPGAGESWQLRPPEEWIGVQVPSIVSAEVYEQAQARLARNQQWATRNTQGEYLLRCLLSCQRCGLACNVWNNGRYAYYRCKGMDVLISRGRTEACHARQVATARLDALVWADLCRVLTEPMLLDEAMRRVQQGWLSSDERLAQRQDLRRRQAELEQRIQRLVDAYAAEVLTLDELRQRRVHLEERLAMLRREEKELAHLAVKEEQLAQIAGQVESFRARVSQGLAEATFAERRALVELLVERVIIDAPDVEIRYIVPLTGAAERKGVLRTRHRAAEQGGEAAHGCGGHLSERSGGGATGRRSLSRAA